MRALVKSDKLALSSAVDHCIVTLSKFNELSESVRVRNRFEVDKLEFARMSLRGLSKMNPNLVSNRTIRFMDKLVAETGWSDISQESVRDIASVLAVHGITDVSSDYIGILKKRLRHDPVVLIGALRKLKEERKFVWTLYSGIDGKYDQKILTEYMSSVVAVNGWADRVKTVIERRDPAVDLDGKTVAQFVRAFSHFPSSPETSKTVWDIVALDELGIENSDIREAVIEFYLVNDQLRAVHTLLSTHGCSERLAKRICRRTNGPQLLSLLHELRAQADEKAFNKGVDVALKLKSAKRLFQVLEAMHAKGFSLHPIQESAVREISESFDVSVRLRKRLTALIEMICKNSEEFIQPILAS